MEAQPSGDSADESDEEEAPLLPPDLPVWSECVSFVGLGRDVVGMVASRLCAADRFSLALTCHVNYERLKLLGVLVGRCSAKQRFLSRFPGRGVGGSVKGLNIVPLLAELLCVPVPELAFPPPWSRGRAVLVCPRIEDKLPLNPKAGQAEFPFHTPSVGTPELERIFRARGFDVALEMVPTVAAATKRDREALDVLVEKLQKKADSGGELMSTRINLLSLYWRRVLLHYVVVVRLCEEYDEVVDCFHWTRHVTFIQRVLELPRLKNYQLCHVESHFRKAFKLLEFRGHGVPPAEGPPKRPSASEAWALASAVPERHRAAVRQYLELRRELVLYANMLLNQRGLRLVRQVRLASVLQERVNHIWREGSRVPPDMEHFPEILLRDMDMLAAQLDARTGVIPMPPGRPK